MIAAPTRHPAKARFIPPRARSPGDAPDVRSQREDSAREPARAAEAGGLFRPPMGPWAGIPYRARVPCCCDSGQPDTTPIFDIDRHRANIIVRPLTSLCGSRRIISSSFAGRRRQGPRPPRTREQRSAAPGRTGPEQRLLRAQEPVPRARRDYGSKKGRMI